MRINLREVSAISPDTMQIVVKAMNLYPYTISHLDIYFTCENTEKYNWLMEPSTVDGQEVSKLTVNIDTDYFDIKTGFAGESSMHPIIHECGHLMHPKEDEYVESEVEQNETINHSIGTGNYMEGAGTIIHIRVNDPQLIIQDKYPYGGNKDGDSDAYGGIREEEGDTLLVEGYGGLKPDQSFNDIYVVIQPSQFKENGVEYGIRY